jgi:hypothetical protein
MNYDDLLEVDLIRKEYIGATMYSKFRPGYKWYYLDKQTPKEACLFKNFDSDASVKAPSKLVPMIISGNDCSYLLTLLPKCALM